VYAFEPIPKVYEQLTLLYQNNKIAYNNVQVFNIALTNHVKSKNSSVCFHHVPASDGFSGIMLRPDIENLKLKFDKIYVRCDALDNIISNNAIIKFIKIDTEGGDFDVLRGSERILATSNPVVVFESGRQFAADMYGYTKSDFFQFFKRLDYELFLYTGKKYTEDMWDSPYFYWETWAVSRKSQYYKFFSEKYGDLVLRFVKNQKALPGHTDYEYKNKYEAVMRSKSMRITAPLRKIMGYIRKTK
jgi:FkbM family methyltransferase